MISEIANAGTYDRALQDRVDARMLLEHADLKDAQSIACAADEALHSDAMLRFLATGYKQLVQADVPVRTLVSGLKEAAKRKIANTKLKDISPTKFAAAEARSAKAIETALGKKDVAATKRARMSQMMNAALTKEAYATQAELEKAVRNVKEFLSRPVANIAKTYDSDLVNAMRVLAAKYGIKPAPEGKQPLDYLSAVEKNDPTKYAELRALLQDALDASEGLNGNFQHATVDTARGVLEVLDVLENKAKQSREVVVEGQANDRDEFRKELARALDGIKPTFDLSELGVLRRKTKLDETKVKILSLDAASRSMESWVASLGLPFENAWGRMFRTVRTAATEMRADEAKFLDKYRAILEGMGKDLSKPLPTAVVATELGVPTTFRTRAEILGFLMHMGNESSMRKNLLGRQYVTSREVDGVDGVDGPASAAPVTGPIVAVGASAGGMESFIELLRLMPPDAGMAFVSPTSGRSPPAHIR